MKMLFALVCLTSVTFAQTPPAVDRSRQATPGFWERAWSGAKKGASSAWDSTKHVGGKTADIVKSPFRRSGKKSADTKSGWRQLAMSMTVEPSVVKLPDARAVRVTVQVVNKGKQAMQLEFPSSQRIEVLVKNEAGKVISRSSDDEKLDKEQGFLVINPEERLEYTATIATRDMTAGQAYIIEAFFPGFDELRASRAVMPTK